MNSDTKWVIVCITKPNCPACKIFGPTWKIIKHTLKEDLPISQIIDITWNASQFPPIDLTSLPFSIGRSIAWYPCILLLKERDFKKARNNPFMTIPIHVYGAKTRKTSLSFPIPETPFPRPNLSGIKQWIQKIID